MGRIRTLALLAAMMCACMALLGMAGSALAATNPLALDGPQNGNDPLVQYDPVSQATFIAWADPQAPDSGVELCVIPKDAAGCEGGAPVLLSVSSAQNAAITGDNTIGLGGLVVEPNGDVIVIGTPVSNSSVAWESPADGSAFLTAGQGLQNSGAFISPVSLFYTFGNAVPLGNTDVGLLDDYGDYFSDSPFSGPESPAIASSNSNQGNGGLYPRKAQSTDGPEVAAEAAPAPAAAGDEVVVAVGDNYAGPNTTLPGCVNSAGTGFGVDVGSVNGTSNAPGTLNAVTDGNSVSAYSLLACSAENPVLTSGVGQAGIGVLENEGNGISGAGSTYTVDYRPFVASASGGSFGAPVQLLSTNDEVGSLDLVDDSGDGVYAMWQHNGTYVDYSANGGVTWGGPVLIPAPSTEDGEISAPVITGIGDGAFALAYNNNPGTGVETFLSAYSYQQLLLAPTTLGSKQTSGTSSGASISIPAGTVGETDTALIAGAHASVATGTVTYKLYSAAGCAASSLLSTSSGTVAGGVATASAPITAGLAEGNYYWQDAYSGDGANGASTSACGSEILTVGAAATAPSTATTTGSTITLTVTCAGPCTVTVTITVPAAAADLARYAGQPGYVGKPVSGTGEVTVADASFHLGKAGRHALHLKLTRKGKLLFKSHKKFKTTLLLKTKTSHGTFKSSHPLKITRK